MKVLPVKQLGRIFVNQKGFTLIEMMAMLVIIAVMSSVVIKKISDVGTSAENQALWAGIGELNGRETLTWTNLKLAPGGYTNDNDIWSAMDTNLGVNYSWAAAPDASGGTLQFASQSAILGRTTSTPTSAGRWN
jgi:prepilin-type N-terminal cleavage/methylation domain-containing protein